MAEEADGVRRKLRRLGRRQQQRQAASSLASRARLRADDGAREWA
ncbi:hypothetical protein ABZ547_26365 [Streptomyces sparsogenes]